MSTKTKSAAIAPHALHGMLYGGIKGYVVTNRNDVAPEALWTGGGEAKRWLDRLNAINPNYVPLLGSRIKTFGSESKDECNDFLKKEGFSIELEDFQGDQPVGGVCTLHVGVEWLKEGEEEKIRRYTDDGVEQFDAALLTDGLTYLRSPKHQYPVVKIATKGTDTVYMTAADQPLDGLDLLDRVLELDSTSQALGRSRYEGLLFPFVDLDVQPDMEVLKGIALPRKGGKPYSLYQALAQVKFKANHKGAQTSAAAAGQGGIESGPQFVELDQPFYVWKKVAGVDLPVLAAYVAEDSWKNPGEIEIKNS